MDYLQSQHKQFFASLLPNDLQSIIEYTNESAFIINQSLRDKTHLSMDDSRALANIDRIFTLVPPIETSLTVYRGVAVDSQDDIDLDNSGFISTTYDKEISTRFSGSPCCVLVLTIPVGSKVLFVESISSFPEEKEIVLDRSGSFVVTGVKLPNKLRGGYVEIFASYIPKKSITDLTSLTDVIDNIQKQISDIEIIVSYISKDEYYEYYELDSLPILIQHIADGMKIPISNNMITVIEDKLYKVHKISVVQDTNI